MDSPNVNRDFIEKLDGVMLTNTLATMHSFIHLLRRILLIHSENKVENDALMDVDGFPAGDENISYWIVRENTQ